MSVSPDFSVKDVLAWARTKPAGEGYSYINSRTCALAQFGRATGREHLVGPDGTRLLDDWEELQFALAEDDETFGALVIRLEKLCHETPVTQSNWSAIDAYLLDIESVEA